MRVMDIRKRTSAGLMALLEFLLELDNNFSLRATERAAAEAMATQAMSDTNFQQGIVPSLVLGLLILAVTGFAARKWYVWSTRHRRVNRLGQRQVAVEVSSVRTEWVASRPLRARVVDLTGDDRTLREGIRQHGKTTAAQGAVAARARVAVVQARAAAAEARSEPVAAAESGRVGQTEADYQAPADCVAARSRVILVEWGRRLAMRQLREEVRLIRENVNKRRSKQEPMVKKKGHPARAETSADPSATAGGGGLDSAANRVDGVVGSSNNARGRRTAKRVMMRRLTNMSGLLDLRKPTLTGVKQWIGGHLLQVADDGNCAGSSQVAMALVWGVQEVSRLDKLIANVETAEKTGAFVWLDGTAQGCVAVFRGYLDSLRHAWVGYDRDDKGRGIALALDVIISLQGPNADGSKGVQQGQGKRRPLSHPMLHRSVVVMSRVLDLWKAPLSIGHDDFGKLRMINSAVELSVGGPDLGYIRPGRSLGMIMGLTTHSTTMSGDGKLSLVSPDVVNIVCDADASLPVVDGLTILKGGLNHYDVLVASSSSLGKALASRYGAALPDDDTGALEYLRRQEESQEGETGSSAAVGASARGAVGASGAGASGQLKAKKKKRSGGGGGRKNL